HELPILQQRRGGEAALHLVLVGAQRELELHLHARATLRAEPADRVLVSPDGLRAVDRPRDGFEQRRLPRAVGSEDAGDPGAEFELGVRVLPKVQEAEPVKLPQASPSPPTRATSSTPSRTNSARS